MWSLLSMFSDSKFHAFLTSTSRTTCPSHLSLVDSITLIIFGGQHNLWTYSLCNFLHSPVTSFLLGPNILLSILFSNTLNIWYILYYYRSESFV
jgi:hypothetical protein